MLFFPNLTYAQNIEEAKQLMATGEKNLQMGRTDLALENYQKALTIYQKTYTEKHDAVADCYNHLGIVYWNRGNNEMALDYLNKALHIRQSLYQENHAEVAASYNDLGLVYATSQPLTALDFYEKALTIYQKVYPENHPTIANAYNNIALIQRGQKQYEEALINFNKTLEIRKLVYEKDHPNEAFAYLSLGQVYGDLDNYDKALENYEKALKIYQKNYGERHPEIAQTYNLLANLYLKRVDFATAIQHIQQALKANVMDFSPSNDRENPQPKNYYNGNVLLNSLLLKAQIFENLHYQKTLKLKDLTTALSCLEVCDSLIAELRQLRTNKNDKIALGAVAAEVYEEAIRLCMQMSDVTINPSFYTQKAFDFAEKSKSAVLLSAISDAQAKEFAGIPLQVLEEEKTLKAEIILLEQQLANKTNEAETRNKLFELNRKYELFIKDLEQKYPEYYNLKYSIKTATVKNLQAMLPQETALISYFTAEKQKRLYIFEVTKKKFRAYSIPLSENFNTDITVLRNAIVYRVKEQYMTAAQNLYKQLFDIDIPNNIQNLVLIPDGRLGTIPFECLLTKTQKPSKTVLHYQDLPYLVKDYAISYAYSATLFMQNSLKKVKSVGNDMMLIAPVEFHKLTTLKESETEVNTLAKLDSSHTKVYLREKANETLLKSADIQQCKYIHFATHGIVDENIPEKSCIVLHNNKDDAEDGLFTAGEIFNIKLNADLVCLSACQTGLGKISKGEGIIGLTRALVYAGAKNVKVSLWKVADNSTSVLMIDFYKSFIKSKDNLLQNNLKYASHLQSAKLKMIAQGQYAAPFYWSPFILFGE